MNRNTNNLEVKYDDDLQFSINNVHKDEHLKGYTKNERDEPIKEKKEGDDKQLNSSFKRYLLSIN